MRSVRIVVAVEDRQQRKLVVEALRRADIPVLAETGDGSAAYELVQSLTPEVLILDIHLRSPNGFRVADELLSWPHTSLVLLAEPAGLPVLRSMVLGGAAACLLKPVDPDQLGLTVLAVVRQRQQLNALRKRADAAQRRLAERRLVERAKAILMEDLHISEAEAYRHLRSLSMNSRRPLGEVAEMVLQDRSLRSLSF